MPPELKVIVIVRPLEPSPAHRSCPCQGAGTGHGTGGEGAGEGIPRDQHPHLDEGTAPGRADLGGDSRQLHGEQVLDTERAAVDEDRNERTLRVRTTTRGSVSHHWSDARAGDAGANTARTRSSETQNTWHRISVPPPRRLRNFIDP